MNPCTAALPSAMMRGLHRLFQLNIKTIHCGIKLLAKNLSCLQPHEQLSWIHLSCADDHGFSLSKHEGGVS